jgi:hypothetical protein
MAVLPSQQQPPHGVKIVELLIKLVASARSSGKKPVFVLFSLCCVVAFVALLVVDGGNALGFSPSVSTIQTTMKEEKEDSLKTMKKDEDKTLDFWEKLANIALFAACVATIGILVLARRARKNSSHVKIEGQPATIPANTSGQQKSWNGSHWVEQTTHATSVLSSPYRNSPSTTTSSSSSRPPDANWAKAKAPTSVWSKGSESANTNGTNINGTLDEDKTEFATGFGYSEGATSETARERAYRETLWARREAEELEAEENEEDQRNHHEYFTKHEEKEDRRGGNTSTNTRQHQHQQKPSSSVSSSKKEKESASAKRERRWSKFDQRWESLDASSATSRLPLTYNDIPWPPKMAKLLERKVSEQEKQHQHQGTSISKKKVYRELILRWHPDKFMQKYGKRVRAGGDEDRIKERVDAVAKALSASMSSSVSS